MRKITLFLLILTYATMTYSKIITKPLTVSTYINKNAFFTNSVTSMKLFPEYMVLIYDDNIKTFLPMDITLFIETDIPVSSPLSNYSLVLTHNESQCYGATNDAYPKDITHIKIDGIPISIDGSIDITDYNQITNGYKGAQHLVSLKFDSLITPPFDKVVTLHCDGSLTIRMDFDI